MELLPADSSGHVKIEVDVEIDDNDTRSHRCCFYVNTELGQVEQLGKGELCDLHAYGGRVMTAKEQLWYLINGVIDGVYEINTFCDEFYRIYNFETDKAKLTKQESRAFEELFHMAARFSDFEEDLKLPNVFYSGEEILQKVKEVQKIKCWKAHFKDAGHDTDIEILNTEEDSRTNPLRFELDGILFCGRDVSCFCLAKEEQYPEAAQKFHIRKLGGNTVDGRKSPYWYELQRYELEIEIPIWLIRKKDKTEVCGILHLAYKYVEEVIDFSISVEGNTYRSDKNTLFFWDALNNISAKMKENYYIKSCFTCQYAEYSPYGEDDYGTMLCYKGCKKECLKVQKKTTILNIWTETIAMYGRRLMYVRNMKSEISPAVIVVLWRG